MHEPMFGRTFAPVGAEEPGGSKYFRLGVGAGWRTLMMAATTAHDVVHSATPQHHGIHRPTNAASRPASTDGHPRFAKDRYASTSRGRPVPHPPSYSATSVQVDRDDERGPSGQLGPCRCPGEPSDRGACAGAEAAAYRKDRAEAVSVEGTMTRDVRESGLMPGR